MAKKRSSKSKTTATYIVHGLIDPEKDVLMGTLPSGTYDVRISRAYLDGLVSEDYESDRCVHPDTPVHPCVFWVVGKIIRGKHKSRTVQAYFPPPHEDPTIAKWIFEKTGKRIPEVVAERDMEFGELQEQVCQVQVTQFSNGTELGIS